MITSNHFQEACKIFLGVKVADMKDNFMPSARSMAFTKTIWKKAGGFPENLENTAEDTVFNINLIKAGAKFKIAKDAIVDWDLPKDLSEFATSVHDYAKGDAESGIWWHPVKKWKTHNLIVLRKIILYIIFILFPILFPPYLIYVFIVKGIYGIVLQFVSDIAGIIGFSHGLLQTSIKRN